MPAVGIAGKSAWRRRCYLPATTKMLSDRPTQLRTNGLSITKWTQSVDINRCEDGRGVSFHALWAGRWDTEIRAWQKWALAYSTLRQRSNCRSSHIAQQASGQSASKHWSSCIESDYQTTPIFKCRGLGTQTEKIKKSRKSNDMRQLERGKANSRHRQMWSKII